MPPNQHASHPHPPAQHPAHPPHAPAPKRKHIDWAARTIRIEIFIVLVGGALLLAAASLFMGLGSNLNPEARMVNPDKYQAVFLNGGVSSFGTVESAYFGKITSLNDKYLVLEDVYFAPASQQKEDSIANSQQLVKLGCPQVHAPYDRMVINRTEVAFWENLQDEGKVVQAIKKYKQDNPKGPDCNQQPQQQSTSPAPAAPQTAPPASTNPTTNQAPGGNANENGGQ